MGGLGSGNYYRFGKKDTAEECRSLDVRRWQREGILEPGRVFGWAWHRDGREISSIGVAVLRDAVELSYSVESEGRIEDVRYTVPFSWTACNFGGKRPWFVCPGVVNGRYCGRRVAKLYLKRRYFLCRHCHDLTYESRQIAQKYRGLHKCQKIRRRLGGTANMMDPFPPPPKGMRLKTYTRLWLEHYRAEREHLEVMRADIDKLWSQLSRLSGNGDG